MKYLAVLSLLLWANVAFGEATSVTWTSVKTQGAAGEQSLTLNKSAAPGTTTAITIEPRLGGVTKLRAVFNDVVELTGSPIVVRHVLTGTTSSPVGVSLAPDGLSLDLLLGALPNGGCYEVTLSGKISGTASGTDRNVYFRNLLGDVNSDGAVDMTDALAIKGKIALVPAGSNAKYDGTANGQLNLGDALLARSQLGQKSICPQS